MAALLPGSVWYKGNLTFGWEALPAAMSLFGLPENFAPLPEPVVDLPGREEYQRCFAAKLRKYQKEMLQFLVLRSYAINADPMRCLAGSTKLTINRAGKASVMTLAQLSKRLPTWRRDIPTRTQSMDAQGSIVLNDITLLHRSGRKNCIKVQFSNGSVLTATEDHKVQTPGGMVRLGDLNTGSRVLVVEWPTKMSQERHSCLHSEKDAWHHVNGRAVIATITAMEFAGEQETFDLTMANPLNNYVADGVVVSNSGKTPTTLAAASILGIQKVLIVCPSIAKLVWATELVKWMQQPSLILYGRSCDEARTFCVTCNGTGRDSKGKHCLVCKRSNGQSYGAHIHQTPEAIATAMHDARFIIANFDILTPQMQRDAAGKRSEREDLPGWYKLLDAAGFKLLIIDEAHILRGRSKGNRIGESRRDKLLHISKSIERVWGLTGTPIYGRVADLWALLDVITNGLYGRPGWDFDKRYCLPAGERVWMGDLSHQNIEKLKVGDEVWGWTASAASAPGKRADGKHRRLQRAQVLEVFQREAEVVEAKLASGRTVRSTRDHLWASPTSKTVPYRKLSAGRTQDRKYRRGLPMRPSYLARVLDAEYPVGETSSHDYLRGYAHGFCDGDGTVGFRWYLRSRRNKTCADLIRRVSVRQDSMNVEALVRLEHALTTLGVPYRKSGDKTFPSIEAQGSQALEFFYKLRRGTDNYWRGWLAGIYDAEGWGSTFAQHIAVNPETHSNIRDALTRFGFKISYNREAVKILGRGKSVKGAATQEFVRFWLLVQPAIKRKMEPMLNAALYWEHDPVVSLRSLGVQKVYDIKTTTQNFIVNGYGSHNCNGHKGEYGWINDGMTNPEELKSRLDTYLLKRDRKDILPELPPKSRQIIRIDAGKADFKKPKGGSGTGGIHSALRVTADIKEKYVVEGVSNEAAEGAKVVVFTYLRDNAAALYSAFEAAKKDDPRLKLRNLQVWCVTGDTNVEARFKQAQAFREWTGAGIFIATIESVPVAISLKGAQSVHFADITFDPASLLQAEDRPYEVGTNGLAIVYYVVEKTIDEHVIELVLPKMEMLESVMAESAATDFTGAFRHKLSPEEMAEEIWARMEAAAL